MVRLIRTHEGFPPVDPALAAQLLTIADHLPDSDMASSGRSIVLSENGEAATLVEAVTQRLNSIQERASELVAEQREHEDRQRELRRALTKLREEWLDLQRLYVRYTRTEARATGRIGPTEAIIGLLESQPKHRMSYYELLDRLEADIGAGRVVTTSDHPRKLISATLGLLVKRGRLVRTGDTVLLPEEPRSASRIGLSR
jgi:hypothetical protein